MMHCLFLIVALQIGQADITPAPASVPAAASHPADNRNTDASLNVLLDQLGDDNFEQRQAASAKLRTLTEAQVAAALPQIAARYRATHDAEIRMRLARFADDCFDRLVLPHYDQLHQPGFLGVTPARAKLGDGTIAVVVTSVLPNSPAIKAGLTSGDLITAVDDQPLDKSDPVGAFIKAVQQRHAGMRVQFTLRRGDQTLTVAAQLDALPDQYRDQRIVEFRQQQTEILRRSWWDIGMAKGVLHPDLPPPPAYTPPTFDSRMIMIDD